MKPRLDLCISPEEHFGMGTPIRYGHSQLGAKQHEEKVLLLSGHFYKYASQRTITSITPSISN